MKKADHKLVQQVLDGDVTREDFDGFQQRLRDEPELVKLYGDYSLLQHTLNEEYEGGHLSEEVSGVASRRLLGIPALLAVAGALVIAAGLLWFRPWAGGTENVAVVTFSVDAVWQIEGVSRDIGSATGVAGGSVLRLSQGRAGISLEPSVTAVVEGPAEVVFLTKNSLHLAQGRGCFNRGGSGGGLTVTTPKLTAEVSGTRFGIKVGAEASDELHVIEGEVRVVSKGGNGSVLLATGDAARVPAAGAIERFPSDGGNFATGLGRFRPVVSGPFVKADWRVDYGNPAISENRIDGENYAVFLRLPELQPAGGNTVLLATLEVGRPASGEFHTDGWAGMSFFGGGNEMLFFGDSFGAKPTWSLDVKQRIPVIVPEPLVTGPRTVTLRYDFKTGEVSLHEGRVPLKTPICVGRLPAGVRFDEIRIGASSGAALAVIALDVRTGGG